MGIFISPIAAINTITVNVAERLIEDRAKFAEIIEKEKVPAYCTVQDTEGDLLELGFFSISSDQVGFTLKNPDIRKLYTNWFNRTTPFEVNVFEIDMVNHMYDLLEQTGFDDDRINVICLMYQPDYSKAAVDSGYVFSVATDLSNFHRSDEDFIEAVVRKLVTMYVYGMDYLWDKLVTANKNVK